MHLPNGSSIFVEGSRQLQGSVSALQQGDNAVATIVGHTLSSGDTVVFAGGGLDGLYAKVQRYDTNRVFLRGTKNFARGKVLDFAGSLAYKVDSWVEIPCVQDINIDGGEQQYYNYQCLSSDREQQLKTFKSAQTITITYAFEHTDAINKLFPQYDDDGGRKLFMMNVPRVKETRLWSGTISYSGIVQTTVNEMETVSVSCSLVQRQSQMPNSIPGTIPVENINVYVDTLIPGQLQIGEYAPRRVGLFPGEANEKRVNWEVSNEKVASIVSGTEAAVLGNSEGMFELSATSYDSGKARGAIALQVIPAVPMRSAVIEPTTYAAKRALVGEKVRFSVKSTVPANSGEAVELNTSNAGVGKVVARADNGRWIDIEIVGASTFKPELFARRDGSTVKIAEQQGWFFGFRQLIELSGNTNLGDKTWPSTDAYRSNIRFTHTGNRNVIGMRDSPTTNDFYLFECVGSATVTFVAGPNMPLQGGANYVLKPNKCIALLPASGGSTQWMIQELN